VELVLHVKRGVDSRVGRLLSYFILRVASVYVIDWRDWSQIDRSVLEVTFWREMIVFPHRPFLIRQVRQISLGRDHLMLISHFKFSSI
jgi:hypothetical protein